MGQTIYLTATVVDPEGDAIDESTVKWSEDSGVQITLRERAPDTSPLCPVDAPNGNTRYFQIEFTAPQITALFSVTFSVADSLDPNLPGTAGLNLEVF